MFKKIIAYLNPRETILKAIKRLGNTTKASGGAGGSTLSASQRWLKKRTNLKLPQLKFLRKQQLIKKHLRSLLVLLIISLIKASMIFTRKLLKALAKKSKILKLSRVDKTKSLIYLQMKLKKRI